MAQCSRYVLAIDQGTTSTRALVVDHAGHVVGSGQQEFRQILPRAGWVEHDPTEIWRSVRHVVAVALADAGVNARSLATIGITNQRETTVVWDRTTGEPVYNAIVWQDTRTQSLVDRLAADGGAEEFAERTGLMPASYFAGPKAAWILDHVEGARARAEAGELAIGTIDSWLLWQLTGGAGSGVHATDVTNASRTMLMNIDTLDWNEELAQRMGVPVAALPTIRSSSEEYGVGRDDGLVSGVPICGILGDQQAATYGQACFAPGMAKNTYGTGNFMLLNTGTECLRSEQGLLTTVAYKIGDAAPVYALEGSIAVTGSLVQWVRDNLGLVRSAAEIEGVAAGVVDNGGAYFVPAFSGLFAPYWRPDARGALVGLTRYVDKRHLARAVLEATAYQTRDVVKAMLADADDLDLDLCELRVDGGMTVNNLLMQFQSDILDVAVVRPENTETTALGAAYAAGVAVGFWEGEDEIAANWTEGARWEPAMEADERERLLRNWDKALTRSFDWVDGDVR